MPKSISPSQTQLRKSLLESLFNPKAPGPMSVILEANNPTYFLQRAIELIRESSLVKSEQRQNRLRQAVSLIAMARILEEEPKAKVIKAKAASKTKEPDVAATPPNPGSRRLEFPIERDNRPLDSGGQPYPGESSSTR